MSLYLGEIIAIREISNFRRETHAVCALTGYYPSSIGNSLPTFRDIPSVTSSGDCLRTIDGVSDSAQNWCNYSFDSELV